MARDNNFLLGRGEALTYPVVVKRMSNEKNPPYTFGEAQVRLEQRIIRANDAFEQLPDEACPQQRVVGVLTMHPRYLAKSDFPEKLFEVSGLHPIGSRLRMIQPDNWGIQKPPATGEGLGEDIFVAGTKRAFRAWASLITDWTEGDDFARAIQRIEDFSAFRAANKVKNLPEDEKDQRVFEVVLHNADNDRRIMASFIKYAHLVGAVPLMSRRKDAKGLTFVPVRGQVKAIAELADFSFVRVARPMPRLRPLRPPVARSLMGGRIALPTRPPVDPDTCVAIFDGGLPASIDLSPWVREIEPPGIGPRKAEHEAHGLAVTSALLFGPLSRKPGDPLCRVDHVRVLDGAESGVELEYTDVLERITSFLDNHKGEYQFVNISLGPQMAIDDDEVTQWTACLDERFACSDILATVAAGNDGELDAASGLNRIQPPADGVNVLSVGACDSLGGEVRRATYSCVGPGRTPGLMKPDGLSFGGSDAEPFLVLRPDSGLHGVMGTSLAAPFALRSAVAVKAQLGDNLHPLTIRSLMIHRAGNDALEDEPIRNEHGWGRFLTDYNQLITCDDDEALVLFQGMLPVGAHLRAPLPIPEGPLPGKIEISATLVIAPEIDPEHAGAYTRSGVLPTFRPDERKKRVADVMTGRLSEHAKSDSFFSLKNMYSAAEFEFREDGQKWEPCIKARKVKRCGSLYKPVFDIQYQHREGVGKAREPRPIPYALVVGMKAPKVVDFYNRVVRAYANYLIPLQPQLRLRYRV